MKRRTVKTMITVLATVLLVGCNSVTSGKQTETIADNRTDNVIVETATENINKWDNTEVYFTRTKEDYDKMTEILENRNGKIIIEVIETTVLDNDGNASDAFGFYVKYESGKYRKGDRVQTVIVYNPDSNYPDDILYRLDNLILWFVALVW